MPQEDSAAKHYMYVLECADGTWYTGYAVDVERRIAAHNAGRGAKYTRARRPVRLVAKAAFDTKHEAMSAEYHFKRLGRAQKELLVAQIGSAVPLEVLLVQGGLVAAGVPSGLCPSDRRPHSQKGPSPMSSSPLSADSALTVRHATPLDVDSSRRLKPSASRRLRRPPGGSSSSVSPLFPSTFGFLSATGSWWLPSTAW